MIPQELGSLRPTRMKTLELIQGLSQQQLNFSPGPKTWSVGEVVDHIVKVEGILRGEIEQLIALAKAGQPTVIRRSCAEFDISLGPMPKSLLPFLDIPLSISSFFTPRPVLEYLAAARWMPFKNPLAATPQACRPAEELRSDLTQSLKATVQRIESEPEIDYGQLVHRHPLMGANTVPDILRFLVSHETRHQKQIADILNTAGFPAPEEAAA